LANGRGYVACLPGLVARRCARGAAEGFIPQTRLTFRSHSLGTIRQFLLLALVRGAKAKIAPMTDRLHSSYERDWSPYTKKTARSAVLGALAQALNNSYEVPQELPREMLALLERLNTSAAR
jgi:hypothetical protein